MSLQSKVEINCPKCNSLNYFTTWDSINVAINPEMKVKALTGELFELECSECKSKTRVVYNCLYHDPVERFMVYLTDEEVTETLDSLIDSEYILRQTTDADEFIGKINILNSGLNDKLVELCKFNCLEQMGSIDKSNIPIYKSYVVFSEDTESLHFLLELPNYYVMKISLPIEKYWDAEAFLFEYLDPEPHDGKLLSINRTWFNSEEFERLMFFYNLS